MIRRNEAIEPTFNVAEGEQVPVPEAPKTVRMVHPMCSRVVDVAEGDVESHTRMGWTAAPAEVNDKE